MEPLTLNKLKEIKDVTNLLTGNEAEYNNTLQMSVGGTVSTGSFIGDVTTTASKNPEIRGNGERVVIDDYANGLHIHPITTLDVTTTTPDEPVVLISNDSGTITSEINTWGALILRSNDAKINFSSFASSENILKIHSASPISPVATLYSNDLIDKHELTIVDQSFSTWGFFNSQWEEVGVRFEVNASTSSITSLNGSSAGYFNTDPKRTLMLSGSSSVFRGLMGRIQLFEQKLFPINELASISINGVAQEGNTISVDISNIMALKSELTNFTYEWQIGNTTQDIYDGSILLIENNTSSSYIISDTQLYVGKFISCKVTATQLSSYEGTFYTPILEILNVNDAPVVVSQTIYFTNNPVTIDLIAIDEDNDQLTYTIETNPSKGALGDIFDTSKVVYTPNNDNDGNDNFTFTVSDDSTNITQSISLTDTYSEIEGTTISESDMNFVRVQNISKISIPDAVITIEDYAFKDCSNVTSITIGPQSQLVSIGNNAFENCQNLKTLFLPSKLESIGTNAFLETGIENYSLFNFSKVVLNIGMGLRCTQNTLGEDKTSRQLNGLNIIGQEVTSLSQSDFQDQANITTFFLDQLSIPSKVGHIAPDTFTTLLDIAQDKISLKQQSWLASSQLSIDTGTRFDIDTPYSIDDKVIHIGKMRCIQDYVPPVLLNGEETASSSFTIQANRLYFIETNNTNLISGYVRAKSNVTISQGNVIPSFMDDDVWDTMIPKVDINLPMPIDFPMSITPPDPRPATFVQPIIIMGREHWPKIELSKGPVVVKEGNSPYLTKLKKDLVIFQYEGTLDDYGQVSQVVGPVYGDITQGTQYTPQWWIKRGFLKNDLVLYDNKVYRAEMDIIIESGMSYPTLDWKHILNELKPDNSDTLQKMKDWYGDWAYDSGVWYCIGSLDEFKPVISGNEFWDKGVSLTEWIPTYDPAMDTYHWEDSSYEDEWSPSKVYSNNDVVVHTFLPNNYHPCVFKCCQNHTSSTSNEPHWKDDTTYWIHLGSVSEYVNRESNKLLWHRNDALRYKKSDFITTDKQPDILRWNWEGNWNWGNEISYEKFFRAWSGGGISPVNADSGGETAQYLFDVSTDDEFIGPSADCTVYRCLRASRFRGAYGYVTASGVYLGYDLETLQIDQYLENDMVLFLPQGIYSTSEEDKLWCCIQNTSSIPLTRTTNVTIPQGGTGTTFILSGSESDINGIDTFRHLYYSATNKELIDQIVLNGDIWQITFTTTVTIADGAELYQRSTPINSPEYWRRVDDEDNGNCLALGTSAEVIRVRNDQKGFIGFNQDPDELRESIRPSGIHFMGLMERFYKHLNERDGDLKQRRTHGVINDDYEDYGKEPHENCYKLPLCGPKRIYNDVNKTYFDLPGITNYSSVILTQNMGLGPWVYRANWENIIGENVSQIPGKQTPDTIIIDTKMSIPLGGTGKTFTVSGIQDARWKVNPGDRVFFSETGSEIVAAVTNDTIRFLYDVSVDTNPSFSLKKEITNHVYPWCGNRFGYEMGYYYKYNGKIYKRITDGPEKIWGFDSTEYSQRPLPNFATPDMDTTNWEYVHEEELFHGLYSLSLPKRNKFTTTNGIISSIPSNAFDQLDITSIKPRHGVFGGADNSSRHSRRYIPKWDYIRKDNHVFVKRTHGMNTFLLYNYNENRWASHLEDQLGSNRRKYYIRGMDPLMDGIDMPVEGFRTNIEYSLFFDQMSLHQHQGLDYYMFTPQSNWVQNEYGTGLDGDGRVGAYMTHWGCVNIHFKTLQERVQLTAENIHILIDAGKWTIYGNRFINFTKYVLPSTLLSKDFIDATNLIGENTTHIPSNIFNGYDEGNTILIPRTVESIASGAFNTSHSRSGYFKIDNRSSVMLTLDHGFTLEDLTFEDSVIYKLECFCPPTFETQLEGENMTDSEKDMFRTTELIKSVFKPGDQLFMRYSAHRNPPPTTVVERAVPALLHNRTNLEPWTISKWSHKEDNSESKISGGCMIYKAVNRVSHPAVFTLYVRNLWGTFNRSGAQMLWHRDYPDTNDSFSFDANFTDHVFDEFTDYFLNNTSNEILHTPQHFIEVLNPDADRVSVVLTSKPIRLPTPFPNPQNPFSNYNNIMPKNSSDSILNDFIIMCNENVNFKNSIHELEIPTGVITIPPNAFDGWTNLIRVLLPTTLTTIGNNAFKDCTYITSVHNNSSVILSVNHGFTPFQLYERTEVIGRNVKVIPEGQFKMDVPTLNVQVFKDQLTLWREEDEFSSTEQFLIPNDILSHPSYQLRKIVIPHSVTEIHNEAFMNCFNLSILNLPNSLQILGNDVFKNCINLTKDATLHNLMFRRSVPSQTGYTYYRDHWDATVHIPIDNADRGIISSSIVNNMHTLQQDYLIISPQTISDDSLAPGMVYDKYTNSATRMSENAGSNGTPPYWNLLPDNTFLEKMNIVESDSVKLTALVQAETNYSHQYLSDGLPIPTSVQFNSMGNINLNMETREMFLGVPVTSTTDVQISTGVNLNGGIAQGPNGGFNAGFNIFIGARVMVKQTFTTTSAGGDSYTLDFSAKVNSSNSKFKRLPKIGYEDGVLEISTGGNFSSQFPFNRIKVGFNDGKIILGLGGKIGILGLGVQINQDIVINAHKYVPLSHVYVEDTGRDDFDHNIKLYLDRYEDTGTSLGDEDDPLIVNSLDSFNGIPDLTSDAEIPNDPLYLPLHKINDEYRPIQFYSNLELPPVDTLQGPHLTPIGWADCRKPDSYLSLSSDDMFFKQHMVYVLIVNNPNLSSNSLQNRPHIILCRAKIDFLRPHNILYALIHGPNKAMYWSDVNFKSSFENVQYLPHVDETDWFETSNWYDSLLQVEEERGNYDNSRLRLLRGVLKQRTQ